MARYFRDLGKGHPFEGSFPGYSVLANTSDQEGYGGTTVHAMGYVNMHHIPSRETPNRFEPGSEGSVDGNKTELFNHTPAELTVNTMYADKRVRPHMMTLMALAKMDHPDADIVASDTLSHFSSKLSQNAHKRGLVKANYDNPDMRSSGSSRDSHSVFTGTEADARRATGAEVWQSIEELTPSHVMAGKQFLKQMLRPGTTRKQTPRVESEQMQLPGMESK